MLTISVGRTRTLLGEGAASMTSAPIRDPLADHLITPQNAALLLIDYQPSQLAGVGSMDHELLRTSNSFRPSTPPAAGSSSSAPSGPKSAWPSPHSMHCAKGMRSIRSSTRSAAPRPRPTAPALTA